MCIFSQLSNKPLKLGKYGITKTYSLFFTINQVYFMSCGSDSNNKNGDIKLPEEPQNCCMSGCANCVWVKYAEEVAKILGDGGETAKQKIFENVKDPNLRAFIMLELQDLFKK